MKSIRFRSIIIYILSVAFIFGLVLFTAKIFTNGNIWATHAINKHIAQTGSLSMAGKIIDRNGAVLAQTVNGKRVYHDNQNIRISTLHTVGDNTKFISTAVQNSYRADLIGYNFITGLTTAGIFGSGSDITLTLDSQLCSQAYSLFGQRNGAAVIYNYKTGEILCMVSTPSYDPANPPVYENIKDNSSYDGVYLNKCLSSSLTPGSIFKVVTCAAAIENIKDIDSRTFNCQGSYTVGNDKITCVQAHGNISFKEAMSQSCNVAFAQLALELSKDKMTKQAEDMKFNSPIYVDSIALAQSVYDVKDATDNQLAWSGSGQHTVLTNPLHMAIIMGAVANNGIASTPYMVEKITSAAKYNNYVGYSQPQQRYLSNETANKIKDMMRYTVKNNYGDSMFPELEVCAKTGTGEVGEDKNPNGWMIGFSSRNDCPLAFAVVVENSGYGYSTAGPIAKTLMNTACDKMINRVE
ncbi:MAG: penicillin-binding transpeptidase domain-containing protein [Clostridia bacterium]|nr:penicillin-binding transpeptidase domain-containing protein [Clostridia bacterium]